MSKPKPKPNQKPNPKPGPEQEAENAANKIVDNESEEWKLEAKKELTELKSFIQKEDELMAFFQQDREKLNYNWIISKKELDDQKSELLNKEREIQDAKENQIMSINLYNQRIRHLLFQNQDQQSELRKEVEITLKQLEDEHRTKERELKTDNRALKVQLKEQEVSQQDYEFAIKSDHDKKLTMLRQEYERTSNEIKKKYDLKMNDLRRDMEDERAQKIKQIEKKKNEKIDKLTANHLKKYQDIKTYYADITAQNLDLIKTLKNTINDLRRHEEQDKKLLQQIEKEFKNLNDPLRALNEEIKMLKEMKVENENIVKQKAEIKKAIESAEIFFRKLEYEYEVKFQQYQFLKKERDSLYSKFNDAIYEIHQKSGLKNLILEKKVSNIQETIEIKELELTQLIKASNLDPAIAGQISNTLDEVEITKNDLISELQQQLQQIRKAHSHMVKAYEGKLSEFVIPVEELGFDPLVPTNTD